MYEYNESDVVKVISGYFDSENPLKLREFPAKQKRQYIALNIIVKVFEVGKNYTEKEVNVILQGIYSDYASLRRALVDYQLLDRTRDCSNYWVKQKKD